MFFVVGCFDGLNGGLNGCLLAVLTASWLLILEFGFRLFC
jgi:hypothetical protein